MTCLTSFGNALIRPLRVLENVGLLRVLEKQNIQCLLYQTCQMTNF